MVLRHKAYRTQCSNTCRGGELKQKIENSGGRQDPKAVMEWLPTIAEALDAVHSKDIVHRDVKPANILFDDWDQAYLSDFGIAKALRGNGSMETEPGMFLGTLAYAAPEQQFGSISPASDQFSLATIVYEAISGGLPYPGIDSPAALSRKAGLVSRASLDDVVSAPTIDVILRSLGPRPSDRFTSCGEFVESLGRTLNVGTRRPERTPKKVLDSSEIPTEVVDRTDAFRRRKQTAVLAIVSIEIDHATRVQNELGEARRSSMARDSRWYFPSE